METGHVSTDLIVYTREHYKLHESAAIAKAVRTGDWELMRRVVISALPRQLGIPSSIIDGDSNYSSARQLQRDFERRLGAQQHN